jgi:mono/diheme cytochrome c family protein
MRVMKFGCLAAILMVSLVCAVAQDQSGEKSSVTVKHVPVTQTSATSGKEMYKNYCAVCHGSGGKGDGPAAAAMKTPPADLTTLAQKSGGKYPAAHVAAVIRGQASLPSHGTQDMPVWGPLFSSISQGHEGQVQQRITNLASYIETLQAK